MIKGFDKEAFMSQPVEVEARQEEIDFETSRGYAIRRLNEQTIVIRVGDAEYDVRELIWRLINLDTREILLEGKLADLESRIEAQENRVF